MRTLRSPDWLLDGMLISRWSDTPVQGSMRDQLMMRLFDLGLTATSMQSARCAHGILIDKSFWGLLWGASEMHGMTEVAQ